MSYSAQARLSSDPSFHARVAACAAVEQDDDPQVWTFAHIWQVAAAPGFADAYESALIAGVENPGDDPAVISDAQILSAVQAELGGAP